MTTDISEDDFVESYYSKRDVGALISTPLSNRYVRVSDTWQETGMVPCGGWGGVPRLP